MQERAEKLFLHNNSGAAASSQVPKEKVLLLLIKFIAIPAIVFQHWDALNYCETFSALEHYKKPGSCHNRKLLVIIIILFIRSPLTSIRSGLSGGSFPLILLPRQF